MIEKTFKTLSGTIHYWLNECDSKLDLIFLPGLTADYRLFDKQIDYFKDKYSVFVWNAPGHATSYPFELNFNLFDKAKWLNEILSIENLNNPVVIGQSMGGYLGQVYAELFPEKIKGFVTIDTPSLQRKYYTSIELGMLKIVEPIFRVYPWKALLKNGSEGVYPCTSVEGEFCACTKHRYYMEPLPSLAVLVEQYQFFRGGVKKTA